MKKIFTLAALAAFAFGGAHAATGFTMTAMGEEVSNGATLTLACGTYEEEIFPDEPDWNSYLLTLDPKIEVVSTNGGAYTTTIKNLSEGSLQWCGFGTQTCGMINGGDSMTRNASLEGGVAEHMELHYQPFLMDRPAAGTVYNIPFEISVYESANPSNVITANITMTYTMTSGINNVEADNVRFTVSGGKVISENSVEVYNLQGQKVANEDLHGIFIVKSGNKSAKLFVK